MLASSRDPIIALATAPGRAAVGVVRLSAPSLSAFVPALLGQDLPPRCATLLTVRDGQGQGLDQVLALYFPAPHSYSGEDVLELQGHGGPVVLQMLLARCLELAQGPLLPGLRLARPGEFTERAYLHGKLDLAQAESVADLIDAGTEAAARSAQRALAGALSQAVHGLAEPLVALRTRLEAALDFPEEEDVDVLREADAQARLDALLAQWQQVLAQTRQGVLLREGLQVVLAGQPNVGKSSLLNALAGQDLAIVTPIAGTTRDRIHTSLQIDGVPLHLVDTAGLRDEQQASDAIERLGIARSWQALREADVLLLLHDSARWHEAEVRAADARIEQRLRDELGDAALQQRLLRVFNKADLVAPPLDHAGGLALSATTGQELLRRAGWQAQPEGVFIARARHLQALQRGGEHLQLARQGLQAQSRLPLDLLAEELRLAHRALGEITGEFGAEDLLGEIFGRFCIGK
jgi:tRNA modification GTPase